MTRNLLKPISTLMKQNEGALRRLSTEMTRQSFQLHHLKAFLPSQIQPHFVAAHLSDRELVLYADSPAWMMRLRFHAPQLVKHVPPNFPHPLRTKLRVVASISATPQPRRQRQVSPAATRTLLESASGTSDEALRAALKRLGSLRRHR